MSIGTNILNTSHFRKFVHKPASDIQNLKTHHPVFQSVCTLKNLKWMGMAIYHSDWEKMWFPSHLKFNLYVRMGYRLEASSMGHICNEVIFSNHWETRCSTFGPWMYYHSESNDSLDKWLFTIFTLHCASSHTFLLNILFLFENGKSPAASSEWNFHFPMWYPFWECDLVRSVSMSFFA